jgi:hypothetical protein
MAPAHRRCCRMAQANQRRHQQPVRSAIRHQLRGQSSQRLDATLARQPSPPPPTHPPSMLPAAATRTGCPRPCPRCPCQSLTPSSQISCAPGSTLDTTWAVTKRREEPRRVLWARTVSPNGRARRLREQRGVDDTPTHGRYTHAMRYAVQPRPRAWRQFCVWSARYQA